MSEYSLGADVEYLQFVDSGSFKGTGNELDNVIVGGAGNDTLSGGAGDDTFNFGAEYTDGCGFDIIDGGAGYDSVSMRGVRSHYVIAWQDATTVTITAIDGSERMTLTSVEQVVFAKPPPQVASAGDDVYAGGAGDDVFDGLAGNDVLSGNGGNDALSGGSGDDYLDGGTGADTLTGGAGNDIYIVDDAGDVVVETGTGLSEIDEVRSSISYALGANVERLTLTGGDPINGTGNELANLIKGNAGDNLLDGGAGADTLQGGAGDDSYEVDSLADVVTELAGAGATRSTPR